MNELLKVEGLWHRYSRDWAIREIGFTITGHGVTGLLGSNGAGKSTTMNILCGVLNQTRGQVRVEGIDIREKPEQAKRLIGFLPQNAPLYPELTVDEYLRYCAALRKMERSAVPRALAWVKERCGIAHYSKRIIRNLSGGYRQRVGIAQALIHQPRLLVLDEPTNGLDPNQIAEVRQLIREIGRERSVLLSSHILSEIQATCTEIKMIEHGQMVFSDTMDAFTNYVTPTAVLMHLENAPPAMELEAVAGVKAVEMVDRKTIRLRSDQPAVLAENIIAICVSKGWRLNEICLEKNSPDEVFARLSGQAAKNNH